MAPARSTREAADDQKAFSEIMREGRKSAWWKALCEQIEARRQNIVEELLTATHDQRHEDILRGRANELRWLLLLDQVQIAEPKQDEGERNEQL